MLCTSEKEINAESVIRLIKSDKAALYPGKGGWLKALINPCFHAAVLIRAAKGCPRWMFFIFRNLLVARHGIDLGRTASIGPGLILPHPVGIVIGGGVIIGSNVAIYQNVTLGMKNEEYPIIGDDARIYPNSVVVGGVKIGKGATIGACSFVDKNVPAGMVFKNGN